MSDEKIADTTEAVANDAPQQAPSAPDLSVNDLNMLRQVIDVASQRGAFRPNEMVNVGTIYNKLDAFLNHVTAGSKEAQGEK